VGLVHGAHLDQELAVLRLHVLRRLPVQRAVRLDGMDHRPVEREERDAVPLQLQAVEGAGDTVAAALQVRVDDLGVDLDQLLVAAVHDPELEAPVLAVRGDHGVVAELHVRARAGQTGEDHGRHHGEAAQAQQRLDGDQGVGHDVGGRHHAVPHRGHRLDAEEEGLQVPLGERAPVQALHRVRAGQQVRAAEEQVARDVRRGQEEVELPPLDPVQVPVQAHRREPGKPPPLGVEGAVGVHEPGPGLVRDPGAEPQVPDRRGLLPALLLGLRRPLAVVVAGHLASLSRAASAHRRTTSPAGRISSIPATLFPACQ